MKHIARLLGLLFILIHISCTNKDSPFLSCNSRISENDNDNHLFVFVGEKISFEQLPYEKGHFDLGFKAKYLILQKVYGEFHGDTIEFVAFDHYGTPPFSKFKNVLLYVSADSGIYYHQKYMFNDVYLTKNGKWAGAYATDDYEHINNENTTIKPVKIEFLEEVSYQTKATLYDNQGILSYKEPYFKIVGDKAIAVYGNYIEELFELKKDGFLTSRNLFNEKEE